MIKAIFTDIDGVLTDGGQWYTKAGLDSLKFNARDYAACFRLRAAEVALVTVSSSDGDIAKRRMKVMKPDIALYDTINKKKAIDGVCRSMGWELSEVAYIGDDHIDLPVLEAVGFSFCPADAVAKVCLVEGIKVCSLEGGQGVLAEVIDFVIEWNKSGQKEEESLQQDASN